MEGTRRELRRAFSTRRRAASVAAVSLATWAGFTLLTQPAYSSQMLSAGLSNIGTALSALVWNQEASHGAAGVLLPVLIAALMGIVVVNTASKLVQSYRSSGTLSGTLGGAIGFLGAGCASCGAGLLTVLGFGGGLALLPFGGLEIQALSVLVLLGSLEYTGRKERVCRVD